MLNPKYHQYFALFAIATFLQAISLANVVMDASAQPEPEGAPSKTLSGGGRLKPIFRVPTNADSQRCSSSSEVSVSPKFLTFVPQTSSHLGNSFQKDSLSLLTYPPKFVLSERSEVLKLELSDNGYFSKLSEGKNYGWEFVNERKFVYGCTQNGRR
jgi:hypothetical protein